MYDELVPGFKEKVVVAEAVVAAAPNQEEARDALHQNMTRDEAVKYGQALGESEADLRRETGESRDSRIRRAMAYAAWDYDGRPQGMIEHLREFGVGIQLTGSLDREATKRLLKKEKTK